MDRPDVRVNVSSFSSHWKCYYDENHQAYYYHNELTGQSQWEIPEDLENELNHGEQQTEARIRSPKSKKSSPKGKRGSPKNKSSPKNKNSPKNKKEKPRMPSHMLMDSSDLFAHSATFFDVDDCYSDMDADGTRAFDPSNPYGVYTVPTFEIPEQRGDFENGRLVDTPIIGGCNQDYINMARTYKVQRPYSDSRITMKCVLCQVNDSNQVLFPCEHRCLCDDCVRKEEICTEKEMNSLKEGHGHCNCPLCATIIKRILPYENGREIEKYWEWVYEIPPPISKEFMRNWKHSAAVIQKCWVQDNDDSSGSSTKSGTCSLS
jgi:WW domain